MLSLSLIIPSPPKIIEWLSPKLLQPDVWLILHLALVLLLEILPGPGFLSVPPPHIHLGNYGSKFPTLMFFEWLGSIHTAYLEGLLFSSMPHPIGPNLSSSICMLQGHHLSWLLMEVIAPFWNAGVLIFQ